MADRNVPLSWYAILNAEQPFFDMFELMRDPRLEPLDVNGQKFGKLTYSAFDDYEDYEEVLHETQELVALLTGTLRISQGPGPLSIVNIIGVFEGGREKTFPPYGGPAAINLGLVNAIKTRQPGIVPHPTFEQYVMEYVLHSGNPRVKDVLNYLSYPPDFFHLYKILEVISKDMGNGDKKRGFDLIENRGWATNTELGAFKNAAEYHRHWDHPAPQMKLQEAVLMCRRIIKEWVAALAGLQV
jgi:hypothetical protein